MIYKLISAYLKVFPEEVECVQAILNCLNELGEEKLFSRKTLPGHITASAFVLSRAADKVLLIKHRQLDKFIQPGGHVDTTDESLVETARRELAEEVGLNDVDLHPWHELNAIPIDIDIHLIPENKMKDEPKHFHFDFRYLFNINSNLQKLGKISTDEIDDYKWISVNDFGLIKEFAKVSNKLILLS